MKKFRKIMAVLVAAIMVAAMTVPTWAATITINQNNTEGTAGAETYKLYKIFDVTKTAAVSSTTFTEPAAGVANGYAYTISTSNPWYNIINGQTDKVTYVTLTQTAGDATKYNVTFNGTNSVAGAKAFAEWLMTAKTNDATNGPSAESAAVTITSSSGSATTTTSIDDGYYLISSSLGTELILATTDLTFETKNSYPSTTKTVSATNYAVGEYVTYTITVTLPETTDWTKPITVHDSMSNVLSLVSANKTSDTTNGWSAKLSDDSDFTSNVSLAASKANNHDASGHTVADNETGFDFVLDVSSLATSGTAETVTITYKAELTSAASSNTDIANKEYVEYSKYKTPTQTTNFQTYDIDLKKLFTGAAADEDLSATFELYPSNDAGTAKGNTTIKFKDGGTVAGKNTTYVKVDSDDGAGSDVITVNYKHGTAEITNIRGLKAGTYYLTEKTTANGYKLLTADVVITIAADGTVTYSGLGSENLSVDSTTTKSEIGIITNVTGTVLPSTGGMGTTVLYIVGGMLIILAGAYLFFSRKKTA